MAKYLLSSEPKDDGDVWTLRFAEDSRQDLGKNYDLSKYFVQYSIEQFASIGDHIDGMIFDLEDLLDKEIFRHNAFAEKYFTGMITRKPSIVRFFSGKGL